MIFSAFLDFLYFFLLFWTLVLLAFWLSICPRYNWAEFFIRNVLKRGFNSFTFIHIRQRTTAVEKSFANLRKAILKND